ncbi:hypothetical protein NDU88_000771 [Pleurodeles waltl]|uniref:Uncharacterized protein n=1 Tax=Pleurodeles waltl TaxID=8319 RepID=A0AAV7LB65_PLEWA|nr:hypothetical protein NDU88_000771 [Pleurodeles waltl]
MAHAPREPRASSHATIGLRLGRDCCQAVPCHVAALRPDDSLLPFRSNLMKSNANRLLEGKSDTRNESRRWTQTAASLINARQNKVPNG